MTEKNTRADVTSKYEKAYQKHYLEEDPKSALPLYHSILVRFPSSVQASYSRSQIQNIVSRIVSQKEIDNTLYRLAMSLFDQNLENENKEQMA